MATPASTRVSCNMFVRTWGHPLTFVSPSLTLLLEATDAHPTNDISIECQIQVEYVCLDGMALTNII